MFKITNFSLHLDLIIIKLFTIQGSSGVKEPFE